MMKTIVILGYMGSGKSTLTNRLKDVLSRNAMDLDDLIVDHEQKSIAQIFDQYGEFYFRNLERKLLRQTILNSNGEILALGGGTPCFYNNMNFIKENTISIYLKITPEIAFDRLKSEKSERPLVAKLNDNELMTFIKKQLDERSKFYEQADHILQGNKNIDELIKSLLQLQLV